MDRFIEITIQAMALGTIIGVLIAVCSLMKDRLISLRLKNPRYAERNEWKYFNIDPSSGSITLRCGFWPYAEEEWVLKDHTITMKPDEKDKSGKIIVIPFSQIAKIAITETKSWKLGKFYQLRIWQKGMSSTLQTGNSFDHLLAFRPIALEAADAIVDQFIEYSDDQQPAHLPKDNTPHGVAPQHDSKIRFALAEAQVQLYFASGPESVQKGDKTGYSAVMEYFDEARQADRENSDLWLAIARFHVKANLQGLQDGSRNLKSREKFLQHYTLFMDDAIKFCKTDTTALEREKAETLEMLEKELNKVPETK